MNEAFGQTNSADVYLYNNNSKCSKKLNCIKYFMAYSLMHIPVGIFNGNSSDDSEMNLLSGTEACSNDNIRLPCGLSDEKCGKYSEFIFLSLMWTFL